MANLQERRPVGSSSAESTQHEIDSLGSQVKELQVFLSDTGTFTSLTVETEVESGYIFRIAPDHLRRLSPLRSGVGGVAQGQAPEARRRLSFMGDQCQRGPDSMNGQGLEESYEERSTSRGPSLDAARNPVRPRADRAILPGKPALLPMTFDGQTAWQDFKVHFELVADLNNWSDAQKATYLAVSLRGTAQEVLNNLPQPERQNYFLLVQALTQVRSQLSNYKLYKVQLKARSRRRDESLTELGQSIRRLTWLAYPDAHQELLEILAKVLQPQLQIFMKSIHIP